MSTKKPAKKKRPPTRADLTVPGATLRKPQETSHRPGPWSAELPIYKVWDMDAMSRNWRIHDDSDVGIALTMCEQRDLYARANAHLIAAAPDLLAACEAILHQHEVFEQPIVSSIEDMLRAAIAKAKGGTA